MLIIHESGVTRPNGRELKSMRDRFSLDRFVHLRGLLGESLLAQVFDALEEVNFRADLTEGIGCVERCMDPSFDAAMTRHLNHRTVLDTVSRIVGRRVQLWLGNTVRRIPGEGHFSNWHNDTTPPMAINGQFYRRVVPLSLNLGREAFSGGNLLMRTVADDHQFADIPNKTPGDALLFEIGPDLQHRVADLSGDVARIVHVGWFHECCSQRTGSQVDLVAEDKS